MNSGIVPATIFDGLILVAVLALGEGVNVLVVGGYVVDVFDVFVTGSSISLIFLGELARTKS